MADFDFETDLRNGFEITLSDNPRKVAGNRALLNRFEITFMTKRRIFGVNNDVFRDPFGGNADKYLGQSRVLNDTQAIAAAVDLAVKETVSSMKEDDAQVESLLPTEKIDRAEVVSLDVISGVITATIQVFPVEVESYEDLRFQLPIVME